MTAKSNHSTSVVEAALKASMRYAKALDDLWQAKKGGQLTAADEFRLKLSAPIFDGHLKSAATAPASKPARSAESPVSGDAAITT